MIRIKRPLTESRPGGAIITASGPNGQHTVIEHRLRTVFGLQTEALLKGLDGAHTLPSR